VGPLSWTPVAKALRKRGWPVIVPAVPAWADLTQPYYPALTQAIAAQCDADARVVLIAHSGAGGLAASVAEVRGSTVEGVIFVDSILPHPGRSWFDTAPAALATPLRSRVADELLPRWDRWFPSEAMARLLPDAAMRETFSAELAAVPEAFCDEPAPACPGWPPARLAYLQLSESYAEEAASAVSAGWIVQRAIIGHLAILAEPDRVAESLHAMLGALTLTP
jgi:hypothetical protein